MKLQSGKSLKNGEYRIEKVLGQGGFGITYLGMQVYLGRRVAIKEFFMSDYCNRDAATSVVSVPTENGKPIVERFRRKFIKEAQNIARLRHTGIIPIIDVFEDNGTAYYIMDYLDGGSLNDKVKMGAIAEAQALKYIGQVASALEYVHSMNMLHLDIKPANILLDGNDNAVIIDFGLAKQYDDTGHQVSTTPVGISHGYAPIEQYRPGGVEKFSPATDIYSLGATLYKLLTGTTPPDVSDIMSNGLPALPGNLSRNVRDAISKAMQPVMSNRPQSVAEFMALLNGATPAAQPLHGPQNTGTSEAETRVPLSNMQKPERKKRFPVIALVSIIAVAMCITVSAVLFFIPASQQTVEENREEFVESVGQQNRESQRLAEEQREAELLLAEQRRADSLAAVQRYNDSITAEKLRIEQEKAEEKEKAERVAQADKYYRQALEAYKNRNYEEMLKLYNKAAEMGHSEANNDLGVCYEYGTAVAQDPEKAYKHYRKSAEAGNLYGQYNLGRCYNNAIGVKQDYKQAVKWYKKSVKQGCAQAEFTLGICYTNGWGVELDHKEAARLYLSAAQKGISDAQNNIAYYYHYGYGVEINKEEAIKWYEKAIAQGNKLAEANLKNLLNGK